MVVINIGNIEAKTIISDAETPDNGVYAWYVTAEKEGGTEPRSPVEKADIAAEVNIAEKIFDKSGVYKIEREYIKTAVEWANLKDALDYWDANNTWLWLSVKNEWDVELATRGSKDTPTDQEQYRGKCFIFKWVRQPKSVMVGIEFRNTTQ